MDRGLTIKRCQSNFFEPGESISRNLSAAHHFQKGVRATAHLSFAAGFVLLAACGTAGSPDSSPLDGSIEDAPSLIDGGSPPADAGDAASAPPLKTTPTLLGSGGEGFYPRAIQLADGTILLSVVAPQKSGRLGATIYESTDRGITFQPVGNVDDPIAAGGLCCGTLYELPRGIGTTPAGTLLWSASVGGNAPASPMQIPIWASGDRGRTWKMWSTLAVAGKPRSGGGLWEPEFHLIDSGALVAHYSDETDPAHSQKLVAVQTLNGTTWVNRKDTVAFANAALRPGMAVVRRLNNKKFVMSYEICAKPADSCTAHLRISNDGWDWGSVNDTGLRPATLSGLHFRHAPTIAYSAAPGANGRIWLVGQMTYDFGGGVSALNNGNILFANTEGGVGAWYPLPAPVPIQNPFDNFCPNYSSAILPLNEGNVALEVASRPEAGKCRAYFARGPILGTGDSEGIVSGAKSRMVSLHSGKCVDVSGGLATAGTRIQQWGCGDFDQQAWTPTMNGDTTFSLKVQHSGMCFGFEGDAKAGTKIVQQPCDADAAAQKWSIRNIGIGHYTLVHSASGLCADVEAGSQENAAAIQLWTCNSLAPQIWKIERL